MTRHERKLKRVRRAEKTVTRLSRMHLIYNLGGARFGTRITSPQHQGEAWTDCSGFAIYLCQVMGIHLPEGMIMSTIGLAEVGREGYSDYFTMFIKNPPGEVDNEHMILRFRKRPKPWHFGVPKYRWAECGGNDNPKSGGGPSWFRPTKARINEFPIRRCFPGL